MQRSGDSLGALAAALAKDQGELTNPEKTLTATLPPGRLRCRCWYRLGS